MRFSLLKAIGAPGSLEFLALGIVVGLGLMYFSARTRRLGRHLVLWLCGGYLVLSLPVSAHSIAGMLPEAGGTIGAGSEGIQELLVLDGDNFRSRAAVACRVFAEHAPRMVWILDSPMLRDEVLACGVPVNRWRWGGGGNTTQRQLAGVRRLAGLPGIGRMGLVASRLQMPRVAGVVRRESLDIVLIPSPLDNEPAAGGARFVVPSLAALQLSEEAMYELTAYAYYWWRGWL